MGVNPSLPGETPEALPEFGVSHEPGRTKFERRGGTTGDPHAEGGPRVAPFGAPHPSGLHPSGLHPSGLHPSGLHTLSSAYSTSKIGRNRIGRSRKKKLAEVDRARSLYANHSSTQLLHFRHLSFWTLWSVVHQLDGVHMSTFPQTDNHRNMHSGGCHVSTK